MDPRGLVLVVVVAATTVPLEAQEPIPLGSDFQVNSYTTGYQQLSEAAIGQDGRFVVAWRGDSSPTSAVDSVVARRFGADGGPLAADFQVNTTTPVDSGGVLLVPITHSVGVADDGDFVVTWQSYSSSGSDNSGYSIQGQRYAAGGAAQGGQFQINSNTTVGQSFPSVAVEGDGDFVVVWSWITFIPSIQGQLFTADGTAVGSEFQVNTNVQILEGGTALGMDADGDFVVAWPLAYSVTDPASLSVHARRFSADGTGLGNDFQVNTYTTGDQGFADIGVAEDGSFVVIWASDGSAGTDTDSSSIQARRYDADGAALGNDFQVNVDTVGAQGNPSLAAHPDGGFVAVWDGPNPSVVEGSRMVKGGVFDADGALVGAEFRVNTATETSQDPFVVIDRDGWFTVTWTVTGDLAGNEKTDIAARQFFSLLGCGLRFEDGFESGDTAAWAATVGEFAGYLDVNGGAASAGVNGLEATVGGECAADPDLVITPPPPTISGPFIGCNTISASGVEVVSPGATFATLNSISLGDDFSVATAAPFVAALDSAFASGLAYVEDDSPSAADSYYARFDLNLDGLVITIGDEIDLFNGYAAAGNARFRARLTRKASSAENLLLLEARLDNGTTVDTAGSEIVLPSGTSTLHVAWKAGAGDGIFVASVDGAPFEGLAGLDNDLQQIDEVRLGYVGGSITTSAGTLDLDEFSSCLL